MGDTQAISYLKKHSTGEIVPISGELIAGRSPDCGLVLTEGHPSRRHARFIVSGSETSVEDLGSANGTFINDERINSAVVLNSGDTVRFDVERFEFRIAAERAASESDDKTMIREPASLDVDGGDLGQSPAWIDPAKQATGGPKTEFIDAASMRELIDAPGQTGSDVPDAIATPMLLISSGAKSGVRFNLTGENDRAEWTIGSDPDRDIALEDQGVSGIHAKLARDGLRWKLSDQLSANGTFVNGKRSNMSYLDDQDRIRFGPVECVFLTPASFGRATVVTRPTKASPRRTTAAFMAAGFVMTLAALYIGFRLFS